MTAYNGPTTSMFLLPEANNGGDPDPVFNGLKDVVLDALQDVSVPEMDLNDPWSIVAPFHENNPVPDLELRPGPDNGHSSPNVLLPLLQLPGCHSPLHLDPLVDAFSPTPVGVLLR
jgi:hypothetical protein